MANGINSNLKSEIVCHHDRRLALLCVVGIVNQQSGIVNQQSDIVPLSIGKLFGVSVASVVRRALLDGNEPVSTYSVLMAVTTCCVNLDGSACHAPHAPTPSE